PAVFSGNTAECRGFLFQVSLYIEMQPQRFPSERARVAFLISLLAGRALAWARALWSAESPAITSFAAFTTRFTEVFCPSTGVTSTADQLLELRQGADSVVDYSLRFRTLAAPSGWNEAALLGTYRRGLNQELQMAMAPYDDTTLGLEPFIQRSVRISQCLTACHTPEAETTQVSASPAPEPKPMQLGSYRLSPQERERRLASRACLYCGDHGHRIAQCPARPPRR
ncbi:nephrocystin-4-like, partial [Silurus meridionalis]